MGVNAAHLSAGRAISKKTITCRMKLSHLKRSPTSYYAYAGSFGLKSVCAFTVDGSKLSQPLSNKE
jgi:hypothetical protein